MNILITGAASGIGYASALALAQRNHAVIATGHTLASLEALRAAADKLGVKLQYEELDITKPSDWEKAASWPIDVLINNAAIGESGPLIEIPLDRFEHLWKTNIVGTLGLSQVVAKQFIQKKSGRVVIVGSTAGLLAIPMLGPYNMTKFALEAAGDALRMELKQFNIHVSLIEPGKIKTGFNQTMTATKYGWLNTQSAYGKQLAKMQKTDARFFAKEYPVEVVVKGVIDAVEARKPKTRYVTPPSTGWAIRVAKMLPDRLRDFVLMKM